jgi:hypothetical protein
MNDWRDKVWASETEVGVYSLDNQKLGVGNLVNIYDPESDDIPEIRMSDGSIVLGCDCWWIPVEVCRNEMSQLGVNEYTVRVRAKGYDGLTLDVHVLAKDPDDALVRACGVEPRYQDTDPYVLLVLVGEEESSVFCTYPNLDEATKHIDTIRDGRWMLVQRDFHDKGEGNVIKSWEDDPK